MHATPTLMPSAVEQRSIGAAAIAKDILIRRLQSLATLSEAEVDLVRSMSDQVKTHDQGATICPRSDGSPHPRLIVSGWACRPRILSDGRRQMLAVHLPIDLLGEAGRRSPLAMLPAVALTPVRTISATPLFDAITNRPEDVPGLVRAWEKIEMISEQHLLDHIVRLGCQTAPQRIASCLLEIHRRMDAIGFTHKSSFPMPLTQEALGELLGMSLVHVNRIVRQFKGEKLVEIAAGVARVIDLPRVALLADWPEPPNSSRSG